MPSHSAAPFSAPRSEMPWWRHWMVWFVIAGPAIVVVASFVTLGAAILYPDPVLSHEDVESAATTPAVQARNHTASPVTRAPRGP